MKDATLHARTTISTLDINDYNSGIFFDTVTNFTLSITVYFDTICMLCLHGSADKQPLSIQIT
jgi:hypothetical protein